MPFRRRTADLAELLGLFEEAGRNVERSAMLLRDLLADYPERAELARELVLCEHEGDRIAHDIIHRIKLADLDSRSLFDATEGYQLATALDDIVDYAEETAGILSVYGVEATMEQAGQMGEVLVGAGEQVSRALRALRTGKDMTPELVEIHRLENEGDRISRDAVASLFAGGIDPMVVIRWKDIFDALESSVDACERVAHVLEGIGLKRRRRR
ncbi:MAG: DUF47 domain-containing protein [Solirubrobacteraceae bacterium]